MSLIKKLCSLLMVFGLVFSSFSVVEAVEGSPTLEDFNVKIYQDGNEISDNFNSSIPLDLELSFRIPVLGDGVSDYYVSGDSVEFLVSDSLQLSVSPSPAFTLDQEESDGSVVWIGSLVLQNTTFTNSSGEIKNGVKATVEMVGDDTLPNAYDGDHLNVIANFNASFNYDDSGDNGDEGSHTIFILDKEYTINVPVVPVEYTVDKSWIKSGQTIDWTVKIDANKGEGNPYNLNGYQFYDDISNAGVYKYGTFKLGTTPTNGEEIDDKMITEDSSVLYYTFSETDFIEGESSIRYFTYQTTISDEDYSSLENLEYTNTAELRKDDLNIESSEPQKISIEKNWIDKTGELTQDIIANTASIDWTIDANELGANLNGVKIYDELPDEVTFVSAQKYKYESSTSTWVKFDSLIELKPSDDYYDFGSITTPIRLVIKTNVKDNLNIGYNSFDVSNTASIFTSASDTAIDTATSENIGVGQNPITKTNASNENQSDYTIDWTVSILDSNITSDLRVLDLLVYGNETFTYDPAIYDLEFQDGTAEGLEIVNTTVVSLLDDKQNRISYNQRYVGTDGFDNGDLTIAVYHIKNKSDGEVVADLLVTTYKNGGLGISDNNGGINTPTNYSFTTMVTNPEIYATNEDTRVYNTALLFSGDTLLNFSRKQVIYNSDMLAKDMLTFGNAENPETNFNSTGATDISEAYNYVTNSVVYRLTLNNNMIDTTSSDTDFKNISFDDKLPEGWVFTDLSSENEYIVFKLNTDGTTYTEIDSSVSPELFTVTKNSDNNEITFNFEEFTTKYIVLLRAEPTETTIDTYFSDNQTITPITNNATLMSDSIQTSVTASQDLTVKSEILSKEYQTSTEGGILNWTIEYKAYNQDHTNLEIEDIIPDGIDLRTDSSGILDIDASEIKINEIELQSDGSYDLGATVTPILGENVLYDAETRTMTFVVDDGTKSYRYTYLTDITGSTGLVVDNTVKLNGVEFNPNAVLSSYTISRFDASASLTRAGYVEVNKTDTMGGPLENAEFAVFTSDGAIALRSGFTGADGTLILRGLVAGEYILKEISAPSGYTVDQREYSVVVTEVDGKINTSVNNQTGENSNVIAFKNVISGTTGNLKISKTLSGDFADTDTDFEFSLEITNLTGTSEYDYIGEGGKANGTIELVDGVGSFSLKADESITILFLPEGETYTLTESDYSSEGYTFTSINETGTIAVDALVTASFANTFSIESITGNLKVSKNVSGNDTESDREFEFTMEIEDFDGTYSYLGSGGKADGTIEFIDGIAEFTLKANQSLTIMYIPMEIAYTVSEQDYSSYGYSTSSLNATGSIMEGITADVVFTNSRSRDLLPAGYPDTNENFPTNTYVIITFLSLGLLAILLVIRKKIIVK